MSPRNTTYETSEDEDAIGMVFASVTGGTEAMFDNEIWTQILYRERINVPGGEILVSDDK